MHFTIEAAAPADVPAIAAILNDAIAHSIAAWREAPMDEDEMAQWFEARNRDFAVLVARGGDGAVLGYASYGGFRAYSGYRHTIEHSVYVRGDARGQGIGTALLARLVERARVQGFHVMIGALEAGNTASLALHAGQGFAETARMPEVGRKFDCWLTLVFVQKMLS
jgi:L-amino acid N-acyltransferase YncA